MSTNTHTHTTHTHTRANSCCTNRTIKQNKPTHLLSHTRAHTRITRWCQDDKYSCPTSTFSQDDKYSCPKSTFSMNHRYIEDHMAPCHVSKLTPRKHDDQTNQHRPKPCMTRWRSGRQVRVPQIHVFDEPQIHRRSLTKQHPSQPNSLFPPTDPRFAGTPAQKPHSNLTA